MSDFTPIQIPIKFLCGHSIPVKDFKGQPCPACKKIARLETLVKRKQKRDAKKSAAEQDAKLNDHCLDWLNAKKIIATALLEWRMVTNSEDADRFAAAIQARLAKDNLLVAQATAVNWSPSR